jgi:DNA-directed RNA polymerase specialized sigma24 family protein
LAVYQARNTNDLRRPSRPWLFTIVHHNAIDALRECASSAWLKAGGVDDESAAYDRERLVCTLDGVRVLERLAPDLCEMITLAKHGGYATAEAAAWLAIPESAAKARLQRAQGLSARRWMTKVCRHQPFPEIPDRRIGHRCEAGGATGMHQPARCGSRSRPRCPSG